MPMPVAAIFHLDLLYGGLGLEDTRVREEMDEWFAASVTYGDERDLAQASLVVEDWPFNNKGYFWHGSHEFVSRLLANPSISLDLWLAFSWINPDAAFQNPVVPMWLVEEPRCLMAVKIGKMRALLTSQYFPLPLLQQLWAAGEAKTAPVLYNQIVECPIMPTAWLVEYRKARWGRDYDPIAVEVDAELNRRGVLMDVITTMMPLER
jgi:hypothetical protein